MLDKIINKTMIKLKIEKFFTRLYKINKINIRKFIAQ